MLKIRSQNFEFGRKNMPVETEKTISLGTRTPESKKKKILFSQFYTASVTNIYFLFRGS